MANQTSVDSATRDARGGLKFNRNTKRARDAEREGEMMGMDLDEVMGEKKDKKKKRVVGSLGEEFRSKVGGGGVSPLSAWPLKVASLVVSQHLCLFACLNYLGIAGCSLQTCLQK